MQGTPHPRQTNVVGKWIPADGYDWVDAEEAGNSRAVIKQNYNQRLAAFNGRKADVYRLLNETEALRNQCRDGLASCSEDGSGYDAHEAARRRDIQYFVWGEAGYYILWSDTLTNVPSELVRDIGTWGDIKIFGYGGDRFWITLKRSIVNFGSTQAGGDNAARMGLRKAERENDGFKPYCGS